MTVDDTHQEARRVQIERLRALTLEQRLRLRAEHVRLGVGDLLERARREADRP